MEKVIEIEENLPPEVSELILKCFHRWNGVYPERTPLKKLECTCGAKMAESENKEQK